MALCWTLDKLGPICHTADDCGLVLAGMAGADPADPTTLATAYRYRPEIAPSSGFRLGVLRDSLDVVQPEIRANFEAACEVLSEFATLDEVSLPAFPYHEMASVILAAEGASAYEDLIEQGVTAGLTSPEDRLGGYAGSVLPAVDYLRALRIRRKANQELDDLLRRYDGIVHPSTPVVAQGIDERFGSYSGKRARRLDLNAAGNLAGTPSIGLFNGFGERGLPTAFQIMGRVGAENAVLAVASAYQARTNWHTRHPDL
jgi:aspartyl-tRNA(Asn)/glutamyl-tRNA(Gln) amidotransferase subunit A